MHSGKHRPGPVNAVLRLLDPFHDSGFVRGPGLHRMAILSPALTSLRRNRQPPWFAYIMGDSIKIVVFWSRAIQPVFHEHIQKNGEQAFSSQAFLILRHRCDSVS